MPQPNLTSSPLPIPLPRDGNAVRSERRPEVQDPDAQTQEHASDDFDFTNSVLLKPPSFSDSSNLFGATKTNDTPHIEAPEQLSVENSNAQAFRQNGRDDMLLPRQTRGRQATNLLSDLHIRTDIAAPTGARISRSGSFESLPRQSASASSLPRLIPSVLAALQSSAGSPSPRSVLSSPQIAAMLDITPLPSPVGSAQDFRLLVRTRSRGSSIGSNPPSGQSLAAGPIPTASPPRRKAYHGLRPTPEGSTLPPSGPQQDARSGESKRSTSEYVPGTIAVPKTRQVAVSGSGTPSDIEQSQSKMHREEFLAVQRGIISPKGMQSTPSATIGTYVSGDDIDEPAAKRAKTEVYTVQSMTDGLPRRYKSIRVLGQGTFSKVYLAVRQNESGDDNVDYRKNSITMAGVKLRSKRLVAVKVVQHGPAGGADAERVEVSLQREVEILKILKHPSVVHLKAFGSADDSRALLVMNYCPGGDLFEVASTHLGVLIPSLVRRIFAELVSAVRYLHQNFIVHRDIKLENVLLNIPVEAHPDVPNWQTLDRAVVTLTDLGLSRRIPEPPESPLLTTRCGSEDYAAPELLMGQQYDGRQTDAWALGVLLYALMEGRLPFDPLPGARGDPAKLRARTPHRIARAEWAWYRYGDEDGDWDAEKGKEYDGAFHCVDGLLKRNSRRKTLAEIRDLPWVKDGINVDGGLRWVEEEAL